MISELEKKLYHGSYMIVEEPNLTECRPGKDFGRGFYLTTDIKQAKRFVKSAVGKAVKNGIAVLNANEGYVSTYEVTDISGLKIFEFKDTDRQWLHCVAAHRRSGILKEELVLWEKYDVIAGKIANDNTNQVITAYLNGVYGKAGTERADDIAIGLLMPEKLTDQICLRTEKAMKVIKYVSSEKQTIKL